MHICPKKLIEWLNKEAFSLTCVPLPMYKDLANVDRIDVKISSAPRSDVSYLFRWGPSGTEAVEKVEAGGAHFALTHNVYLKRANDTACTTIGLLFMSWLCWRSHTLVHGDVLSVGGRHFIVDARCGLSMLDYGVKYHIPLLQGFHVGYWTVLEKITGIQVGFIGLVSALGAVKFANPTTAALYVLLESKETVRFYVEDKLVTVCSNQETALGTALMFLHNCMAVPGFGLWARKADIDKHQSTIIDKPQVHKSLKEQMASGNFVCRVEYNAYVPPKGEVCVHVGSCVPDGWTL